MGCNLTTITIIKSKQIRTSVDMSTHMTLICRYTTKISILYSHTVYKHCIVSSGSVRQHPPFTFSPQSLNETNQYHDKHKTANYYQTYKSQNSIKNTTGGLLASDTYVHKLVHYYKLQCAPGQKCVSNTGVIYGLEPNFYVCVKLSLPEFISCMRFFTTNT